jgi:type IV secretory pathway VirB10-like protein
MLVYRLVSGPHARAAAVSPDEAKLAARADERRAKAEEGARRLKQQDLGQGYQFDAQGNLLGATPDTSELPQNRTYQEPLKTARSAATTAAIARGIERAEAGGYDESEDDLNGEGGGGRRGRHEEEPEDTRREGTSSTSPPASMLGYSTVASASWASRRPERPTGGAGSGGGPSWKVDGELPPKGEEPSQAMERLVDTVERSARATTVQSNGRANGAPAAQGSLAQSAMGTAGYFTPAPTVSPGPSVAGDSLYAGETPAEHGPQPFRSGSVGDMRIGGGPDQIVRQGKFLDCAVVNEIRADLVDSPVIAMVSRDFVSLDGKYVLVPAGSKLLGEAGRVQNLQQERVYIKFDRVIFPDQRSAYFPLRKVPAVDRMGAVGLDGDVDRHLVMQFGAAVMLGVLDGVGAAVQSPSAGSNPALRDLVMARTSGDFSTVIAGAIQKYANVVPTVTVEAGSKMKVFFAEDVRLSPYMATRDLSWLRDR